jgi:hypothetical protein
VRVVDRRVRMLRRFMMVLLFMAYYCCVCFHKLIVLPVAHRTFGRILSPVANL